MNIYTASINSGSNGNCYFVGTNDEAVLIDVGISGREVEHRMLNLGLSINIVKAIFISHEHFDHIKGVRVIAKKYAIPVYVTSATAKQGALFLKQGTHSFEANKAIRLGNISVMPFTKHHDAADPYSFVVSAFGINIGVLTDLGHACQQVIHYFKQCHAVFLEANYDTNMLENGHYPAVLKNRISSNIGHLSNQQAFDLVNTYGASYLSHIFLSHLSNENNTEQFAFAQFDKFNSILNISIAPRYKASDVYTITGESMELKPFLKIKQLQLF
jgi:phosphoribosyl 1,2-cyclic phosphodiesterase